MTQSKLIKFKDRRDELLHQRKLLYNDVVEKLKSINNKKIELCKTYRIKVQKIDEELKILKS